MTYSISGEPVEIVTVKDNKLLLSADKFREILEKVGSRPVSIISINGPLNTGKSYILSQFINFVSNYGDKNWFNSEIKWRNTGVRQSPGISLWSEPVNIRKSGEDVAVLFMETNGKFEKDSNPEELLILALSFVLSSNLIFSTPEKWSEDVLQFLQLFVGYAKGSPNLEPYENFYSLIFMIKGWTTPKTYSYGYHDSMLYPGKQNARDHWLRVNPQERGGLTNYNHWAINSNFRKLAIFLMAENETGIIDNNNFGKEFIDSVKEIAPRFLHPSNVFIKRFRDHKFRGIEMIKLFDQLSSVLSKDRIPRELNFNEYNGEVQSFIACINGFYYYVSEMDWNSRWTLDDEKVKPIPFLSADQVQEFHEELVKKTVTLFLAPNQLQFEQIGNKYEEMFHGLARNGLRFFLNMNALRFDFSKVDYKTEAMKDALETQIQVLKTELFEFMPELSETVDRLIGFDLNCLNTAINSIFGIISKSK